MVVLINGAKSLSTIKLYDLAILIYYGNLWRGVKETWAKSSKKLQELIQKDIMKEADTKQFSAGGKLRILVGKEWTSKQKKQILRSNTLKAWFIIWK